MTTKSSETIDIGTIDNARELVFKAGGRDDRFYVLQPKSEAGEYGYRESYLDFITRFPKHDVKRTNEHYIDDTEGQWFAVFNVDCFDPPYAVIRARSLETALEVFEDEFADWIKVDEDSERDYHSEECNASENRADCNCDIRWNSNGVHIDTDNIQILELELVRVECN